MVVRVEDRGIGCDRDDELKASLPWTEIENYLLNLENKELTLYYQSVEIRIIGHRTPESFVPNADINPIVFTPNSFLIFARKYGSDGSCLRAYYPKQIEEVGSRQRATLEDTLRVIKKFVETGNTDEMSWETGKH